MKHNIAQPIKQLQLRLFVKFCLAASLTLFAIGLCAKPSLPDAASAAEVIQRANNYWISNNPAGNSGWARAAYFTGNQRAFRVLDQESYRDRAVNWGVANSWKIGPEGSGSADAYCCGQTYIDLYRLNPQLIYMADIKANTDALVASANVNGWSWIDAFYMQGPVLARLGNLTGDTNYYQKLWLMYDDMKVRRGLYDASNHLWFRDSNYIYPAKQTASGTNVFWSRGNGWVFAALARVMQEMSTNAPHYADYQTMFQGMATELKSIQSPDGMWRSSLFDTNQFPNPETSGTGFFTYGMAWGVRNRLLPAADFTNAIALAWQGLTNIALNANGRVGYVQGVGAEPANPSAANTTDFGVGAFLLACSEIYLLAPDAPALRPWAGPDQTLLVANQTTATTISLDASQTEIYRGTAVNYSWWDGMNQIASGPITQATLALGIHPVTLQILASDGQTYSNTMVVTVTTNPPPPLLKMRFAFEDSGVTTTDSVSGVALNLVNYNGVAMDLHGGLGSGVGGAGRSLDFTSAAAQGGNGPLAFAEGATNINFGIVSNFTVTFWLKPAGSLLASVYPRFFSLGTNGLADRGMANSLQVLNNGNLIAGGASTSLQAFVNSTQTSASSFGAFDMPTGQWRFLALTYDGATLNLYGGSETNAASLLATASFPAGSINLGNSFTIFLGNRISDQNRAFYGWLDDVRFYVGAGNSRFVDGVREQAVAPPVVAGDFAGVTNFALQINTRLGTSYILESASNLTPPVIWTPMLTNAGTGGSITNEVPLATTSASQFFRYQLQ